MTPLAQTSDAAQSFKFEGMTGSRLSTTTKEERRRKMNDDVYHTQ
jgi:hypothetical protein